MVALLVCDSCSFDGDSGRVTLALVKHWECLLEEAARRDACSKSAPPPYFLMTRLDFSLLGSPVINQTGTGYMTLVSVPSDKGL